MSNKQVGIRAQGLRHYARVPVRRATAGLNYGSVQFVVGSWSFVAREDVSVASSRWSPAAALLSADAAGRSGSPQSG
ncbi:hypothetical protein AOLI_G00002710 [Acnodon oligacanthus]